ncbi:TPA: phage adsorption protein NrfB [Escherichia coli]|nr:phage adsorption protein NrfB [Escherichia coli]HCN7861051.1 phage adsorption protein NrfB [Escherichia coli]
MSEGPGGPQGATAGGTLAMRMLSQQAMVASQMKRAANDKAIAQMLASKKSGPPAARLGDEIQHKSFLGALAGAVLGAIVTIAEGCLIMAACATGPYALVLVPALMYASYKASDYVEEKQNQLESWINSFCDTDGAINTGSENVKINGKPAARAAVTLPPPPPPGAIPEVPQGEPSWGDIATDLLESAAEKAVPLAKAWGNAVITLTDSNAGFMDRVSAGASLLFPAGPVLMEFATMVGGRGEIKKDVDFPEAGEDTALCDKENKPPRIAQGSSNVFINNQPAARQGDKLECSAAIVGGSPDVFIGGEQVTYLDIQPEFPPWQRMILGGITIASYLLPPAGLLGKLKNLARLGKLGNLLGKSGKLLGAKLGALLGKTGKSLKSIANKVIRWVTDPVDPVTGAYCDERTDFTLGQTLPLSFTRFHSSVLPLHGLTGVGWSDSWSEYAWVREQGNRVDIISLGATLNFAFDGESDTAVNPYHAQYILRRRDDYLELFDRDALSSRFFYDAFPGMRLRHPVTDDTSDDRLAHSPGDRMYMLGGMSDTASNRITFERDSQYRITGVSHTDGIRLKLTYHASGYLKAIHRTDNGIQTLATYEQDARGRLTEADARLDYHLFYEYDAADRIIRWSDNDQTWSRFTYDAQGRCVNVTGAEGYYNATLDYGDGCTTVTDGNLINFMANWRALKQVLQHGDPRRVAWDKTTHDFPSVTGDTRSLRPLGQILLENQVITEEQLDTALRNRVEGLRLGGSMLMQGLISAEQLAQALAEQNGVAWESIDAWQIPSSLIAEMPASVALHYAVLPLRLENDELIVGSEDGIDPVSLAALTRKVGRKVRYVIVLRGQIVTGLRHWYARRRGHDPRAMLYNAVQHQWLTEQQTGEIWRQYVPHQFLFAEILTTLGHINRSAINVLLLRHERSSLPLGKFLVTEGVISQETLDRVLTIQRELQVSMQSLLLKAGLNTEQVAQLESENEGE